MEEVYVIKLRHEPNVNCHVLPSEQTYSSSLVLGLATIHLAAGALTTIFGILGVLREFDSNFLGTGIWIGIIFSTTGMFGLVASKKWYEDCNIKYFLIASAISLAAALLLLALSVYGIIARDAEIERRRLAARYEPFSVPSMWTHPAPPSSAVTGNLMIAACFELVWSTISTRISWDGYLNVKKKQWRRVKRNKVVVATDVPPEYGAKTPDILCHVTNPNSNKYQVARMNPLCSDECDSSTGVPSQSTMDYRDRVQAFLNQALELANQQQAVNIDNQDYGSEVA